MNKLFKHAFTLIELLVVIAIIGILSGLIVVSMGGMTQKATIAKAQVFSNSLRNSMMMDIVAEYKLDGNANDTWGYIPAGTITGATPEPSDCVYGTCYSFNGDDYINYGDQSALSFTNNIFTFSFWVKRGSSSGTIAVLGKTNGSANPYEYSIFGTNGSTLSFYAWEPSGSGVYLNTVAVNEGWNFFVWTANGTNSYVYKNGAIGSPVAKSANNLVNTTGVFVIGRACVSAACYFHNGLLDDIRIYDIAVPVSQIKEQYYAGLNSLLANGAVNSTEYYSKIQEFSSIDF